MTTITKLSNGECILVTMQDEENEVRVHLHLDGGICYQDLYGGICYQDLVGLVVKSAKLGLLYEEGSVMGGECQE